MALFAFAGCKKSDKPIAKHGNTVYVAGNTDSKPILWKDTLAAVVLPGLPDGYGLTSAITTSGNDVYIVGSIGSSYIGETVIAVYWKNKVLTRVSDGHSNAEGNAISVSGSDVYVAGSISPNGVTDACYWKNGALTNLASPAAFTSSRALGIAVNGPDVYVCGNIVKNGKQAEAVYWKNGVLNEITDGSAPAYAVAINVKNNSVHIAYNVYTPNSVAVASYYWKDGVSAQLSNPYAYTSINGLTVDATGVYIAGEAQIGQQVIPVLWQNNAIQALTATYSYSKTQSVFLLGNDVYAAGWDGEPVYWKNGERFTLIKRPDQTGYRTSGIAVISH